ncbi:glycerophosphodiester phosphodiesterase family protein [Parasphingopyxis sp.]|uniref:glycerophosphodiester phosphodiesterase family protein n=1 Tax=Parasphingopyxis sp. TaxID=1920299 RepID=UPI00262E1DEC|nr:glycerophosphodiester phosphodiesterase family protein [Parasphingopyxis sp.]
MTHIPKILLFAACGALAACASPILLTESRLPEPSTAMVMPEGGLGAFLACMRERDATLISAHRGGPEPGFPENALETLVHVMAQAPMLLEIDVRRSSDGVLLLFHDAELDTDTEASGPFAAQTAATLRTLRLRDNDGQLTEARIPALADIVEWARGRAVLQLDVKRGVPHEEAVAMLQAHDAEDYAAIITYTIPDAARVTAASDRVMISTSIDEIEDLDALIARGIPPERIIAWTGLDTPRPELWAALAERGVSANFGTLWTLDEAIAAAGSDEAYARFAQQGADILSTDRHHQAFAALETRQNTAEAVRACGAR